MIRVFENPEKTASLDKYAYNNKYLLNECAKEVQPQLELKPEIVVFGKKRNQQRNVGFFSDESVGYEYSKKLMKSKQLSNNLNLLLNDVNNLLKSNFNGILINEYENGMNYISAHSDDEKNLDPSGVVTLSFGAQRMFKIRNKSDKKEVHREFTEHSTILVMRGNFQSLYTHEIPIEKKITNTRISFTFRYHTK